MTKKTCFVVSIIGEENSQERKHADDILEHIITPALEEEFEIVRADKMYHADKIDDKIFKKLKEVDLVIADLTGNNPNVFLEVGYRLALGLNTIYLVQKSNKRLPFDIQSINVIHYDIQGADVLNSVKETKERLKRTVEIMDFNNSHEETTQNENHSIKLLNDIKIMLLNLNDKIENVSVSGANEPGNRLLEMAFENPENFEKLTKIMDMYPHIFYQNK